MYERKHDFWAYLEASATPEMVEKDKQLILKLFPNAVRIVKTPIDKGDDHGIDYYVYLGGGIRYTVDVKRRTKGCRKYWKNGWPDLQMEIWSNKEKRQIGWTLDDTKQTDIVIFSYDDSDFEKSIWFWFKELVAVFRMNFRIWYKMYFHKKQTQAQGFHSLVLFVPFDVVWDTLKKARKSGSFSLL